MPEMPPIRKIAIAADGEQQGRGELDRPPPQRGDPVEDLDPRRHGDQNELSITKTRIASGIGAVNMWCAQVRKPRKAIATVEAAIAL